MDTRPLSRLQARFVEEFVVDLCGSRAAIRAGYAERSAGSTSTKLLADERISARIAEAMEARGKRTEITADWLLRRLAEEATADIADLYDPEGQLLPVHEWPKIWRQGLVQGFEVEELFEGTGPGRKRTGVVRKVKLDSRIRRLELIGKHVDVRAFQERAELDLRSSDGSMTPKEPVYRIVKE